jgi:hypothetical protein
VIRYTPKKSWYSRKSRNVFGVVLISSAVVGTFSSRVIRRSDVDAYAGWFAGGGHRREASGKGGTLGRAEERPAFIRVRAVH